MAQVDLENVSRTYSDHVDVHALRSVTLSLEPGSFVAVAGPSGSGKTTLLNIIGGLDRPDQGVVRIANLNLTSTPPDQLADFRLRHIGFVFQAYNLFPVLTAMENLEFIPALQGMPKAERLRRAETLLEMVGLAEIRDKRPNEMSGGQQQRVAVVRAIMTEPEIVLADEPTANLDSASASVLLDMMAELNRQKGITFLFSTHDPLVMERARRLIRLKDGAVVSDENRDPEPAKAAR
ncbi:MAG TPA: ABC transporter ATP-binding protein [Terriglobia bacterium]|nr:ABC transporter ATP-binding protein [Terriglobia bacterium]